MKRNIFSVFNRKKVTGLYISHNTVDLVVLRGTLKGPKLVKFGQTYIYPKEKKEEVMSESLNAAATAETARKEPAKKTRDDYIVEAIKRVFKDNDVRPGNVACAISSEEAMVRYFQMPKMPKQEWTSAINFEAKRYIPFRMEDVASDFQVIQSKASSSSMDVVFVAVKQKVIEDYVSLLERAGVKPVVVEPAPFSFIRAFYAAEQINDKDNTAVVNISERSANINILRHGIPYIIRDIPFDESASTAEKSLEPIFEKLLAEVKLSFDFYEKQFPSEIIDKIIIYSHLPLENWHELVGKELQIPVEVGDPLRGIRIRQDIVPPGLAVSFGLALRGLSEPFIEVNLCREKMLVYKSKELFLKMLFLEASAAVFLLIILKLICMKFVAPLSGELDRTLSERPKAEISVTADDIGALQRIKNEMETEKNLLEKVIAGRTYITAKLAALSKLVPNNIWLTEMSFEEKIGKKKVPDVFRHFNIKGYCIIDERIRETDVINDFLEDLKNNNDINKGISKADILSVEQTEIDGTKAAQFEILLAGP